VTTLIARRMPVLFAVSGGDSIPGLRGALAVPSEAAGIVVISARGLGGMPRRAAATLGAHLMSPSWRPAAALEERVAEALRVAGIEIPAAHRVPATMPLPAALTGGSVPLVVLTLDLSVGLERLSAAGAALRALRDEGIALAGIAHDGPAASGGPEMLATVSLILGAAHDDDRVAELGTRHGGLGFVLLPELHDSFDDDGCCFWSADAAGEMPHEVLAQLRPFLLADESGENQQDMKKKGSAIHITRFDKTRLMRLLRSLDAAHENRGEVEDLERELERGIEVESTEVAPDVVTMNSTVRVTDLDANTTHLFTIVFPADADFEKGRISILSPLGTALLGYHAGDVVMWEMPRGTRRLRIEELLYQPEAAGDFHL